MARVSNVISQAINHSGASCVRSVPVLAYERARPFLRVQYRTWSGLWGRALRVPSPRMVLSVRLDRNYRWGWLVGRPRRSIDHQVW